MLLLRVKKTFRKLVFPLILILLLSILLLSHALWLYLFPDSRRTLRLFLFLMSFIKQLPIVYCFPVYHAPYILMLFLNHCHFFLLQGRRIKNYCSVKVVTNIFHPIRLLVFSDSYFLLLFYPSLVW